MNPGSSGWLPAIATLSTPGNAAARAEQRAVEGVHFFEVRPLLEVSGIPRGRKLVFRLEDTVGRETGVHLLQAPEALDEQARAGEQHDGQGELGDDEHGAHAAAATSRCSMAAAFTAERRERIDAERLKNRNEAEDQTNGDGNTDRERKHAQHPARRRSAAARPAARAPRAFAGQ